MRGIGRQAQTVELFPSANPGIGRILVRTLLGQPPEPGLRTLTLFLRKALGGSLDDVRRGGQYHVCGSVTSLHTGYTSS